MRRRNFIAGLGSATFALPITARAQKAQRVRRIGVLMNLAADDPEGKVRSDALLSALQ
jgi:putative ABC transport system substrate-binding protein